MLKRVIADDTIIIDGHDEAFPKSLSLQKKKKFLQVGITIFDGYDQTCPKYPK